MEQGPRPLTPHHGIQLSNIKKNLVAQISTTKTPLTSNTSYFSMPFVNDILIDPVFIQSVFKWVNWWCSYDFNTVQYLMYISQALWTCEKSGQLWSVCVWDPYTGTSVMSYRGSSSQPHTLCFVRDDYVLAAASNKPLINVWSMQRQVY